MTARPARHPGPLAAVALFFVLTGALSAPLMLVSAVTGVFLAPGLPLAALSVVCPALAALLVLRWERRPLSRLLARRHGTRHSGRWWLAAFIPLVVALVSFLIQRRTSAIPRPTIDVASAAALLAVLYIAALLEELGWSAFAVRRLRERLRPLAVGLVVGGVWAAWHYPALIQAGRAADWIAWWTFGTLAQRLIMTWLYEGSGDRLAVVALFHALSNLAWQLYPEKGSRFDPQLHATMMMLAALVMMFVGCSRPKASRQAD